MIEGFGVRIPCERFFFYFSISTGSYTSFRGPLALFKELKKKENMRVSAQHFITFPKWVANEIFCLSTDVRIA